MDIDKTSPMGETDETPNTPANSLKGGQGRRRRKVSDGGANF